MIQTVVYSLVLERTAFDGSFFEWIGSHCVTEPNQRGQFEALALKGSSVLAVSIRWTDNDYNTG